jgi:hypothetical protein
MDTPFKNFTREQLEKKLLHLIDFLSYKLAEDFNTRVHPEAKIIRTAEAEHENDERIKELIVALHPAWDLVLAFNPSTDYLTEWVTTNHQKIIIAPCTCSGCKE